MTAGTLPRTEDEAAPTTSADARSLHQARVTLLVGAALVASLGLGLRVAWAQYSPAVPEPPRFDDSLFYYNMARNIAEGRGYVHPASGLATAQWPPGYPAFLAAIFSVTGPSVTAAEIANALLGALTVLLTLALALRLTSNRVSALAAATIVACSPSLIMVSGVVWSETLFTTLFVAGLVLIVVVPGLDHRRQIAAVVALAAVTAAAALTREAGLVLLPVAAVFWLTASGASRPWLIRSGLCALVALALILPWSIRNYAAIDTAMLVSSSSAGNFWQGHHADGISDDIVQEYGPLNRPGGEADVNRAMWREGWDYATSHPSDEFTALFSKTRTLYHGDRAGIDLNDGYGFLPFMSDNARDRWGWLSDIFYYGSLLLAGVGLLSSGLRSPLVRLVAPVVLFWTLGHIVFFTDPRFHLPLIPVFALAAGAGIAWCLNSSRAALRSSSGAARTIVALGLAALLAIAGGVLLAARNLDAPDDAESRPDVSSIAPPPPAIDARVLCSLSNDDASAAFIDGHDGGISVVVGDKTWWLFGDTLFRGDSGKQIEQNTIAWSDSTRDDGCPQLNYLARDGIAVPFIEKDGSLTVWPVGAWPETDHTFLMYIAYVYGSGPYNYTIDEIGVGRFDSDTQQTTILNRRLWDNTSTLPSHIIGAAPVEVGDDGKLSVVLQGLDGPKYLTRVSLDDIEVVAAYEFWNVDTWSNNLSDAAPLWAADQPETDLERLTAFEGGASIAWNDAVGAYVAMLNTGFDSAGIRTAPALEGPWSEPQTWFSCLDFARPRVPACYSPLQHTQLAERDGFVLHATVSALEPYETHFIEATVGNAIHEYRRGDEVIYAAAISSGEWEDQGVAFYASWEYRDGFVPVREWTLGDERRFATESPGEGWSAGGAGFYAAPAETIPDSLVRYRPVYDWADGSAMGATHVLSLLPAGLEQYGYKRGEIMFYAP